MNYTKGRNSYIYGRPDSYVCAEYVLETWVARTEEIRILDFDLKHMYSENGLETWLIANEEIRVFTADQHPICAEYKLELRGL